MHRLFTAHALRLLVVALAAGATCGVVAAQGAPGAASAAAAASAASAPAGPTVRPEIARPVQAAQEAMRAKDYKAALGKLAEAEAVGGLTDYEAYVIARLRSASALGAGDALLAIASLDKVIASPQLPAGERTQFLDVLARMALQVKDYRKAVAALAAYKDAGGADESLRRLYPQVLAETGDFAAAVRESQLLVRADAAAGRPSHESLLRNLAASQDKLGDAAGYLATLERLAVQHPKPDYWSELVSRTERAPGFNGERLRLDVYRLLRAAGIALDADELGDMAQRAYRAGLPAEAQSLLDEGFASGVLGKGRDAAAQRQLRESATKAAAQDRATLADSERSALAGKDGNALVGLGLALSGAGGHDKAVALMGEGLSRGGLRRPEEARLHQGIVLWRAGRVAEARRAWAGVQGGEGAGDLARLWALLIDRAKKP